MLAEFTRDHWPWFGLVVACVYGAVTAPIGRSLSVESLLGVFCYVLSFALATGYLWVPAGHRETAILVWQIHMFALLVIYSLAIMSRAPSWVEIIPGTFLILACLFGALVVLLLVLHQDNWLWNDGTLVFGFMPIGLLYHAGISMAASVTQDA